MHDCSIFFFRNDGTCVIDTCFTVATAPAAARSGFTAAVFDNNDETVGFLREGGPTGGREKDVRPAKPGGRMEAGGSGPAPQRPLTGDDEKTNGCS